jgi:hypothetical protein
MEEHLVGVYVVIDVSVASERALLMRMYWSNTGVGGLRRFG